MANKETNPETEGSPLKVSLNHLRERFFPKKTPVTLPDSSLKAGLGPIYSDARIYTFRDKHGKETHVFGRLEDIQNRSLLHSIKKAIKTKSKIPADIVDSEGKVIGQADVKFVKGKMQVTLEDK